MFMNDPDYVLSVFVFSNATSNKDKRSHYERLRKRTKSKGAKGCQSRKRSHLDEFLLRLKHQMISLNKQPAMNCMLLILQGPVN